MLTLKQEQIHDEYMCEYINEAIIQEFFTMEKTISDESGDLWYALRDDCYFLCPTVPAQEERPGDPLNQDYILYKEASDVLNTSHCFMCDRRNGRRLHAARYPILRLTV